MVAGNATAAVSLEMELARFSEITD